MRMRRGSGIGSRARSPEPDCGGHATRRRPSRASRGQTLRCLQRLDAPQGVWPLHEIAPQSHRKQFVIPRFRGKGLTPTVRENADPRFLQAPTRQASGIAANRASELADGRSRPRDSGQCRTSIPKQKQRHVRTSPDTPHHRSGCSAP